jgi:acyl transferase domain-containing protein
MPKYAILFAPAVLSHNMKDYKLLYLYNNFVKKRFEETSLLTGIPVKVLLKEEENTTHYSYFQVVKFALFTGMYGIAEHIVSLEKKLPAVSGGISLGDLNAVALSQAISFKDAINILKLRTEAEDDKEAVALTYVNKDDDFKYYDNFENMNIAVNFGLVDANSRRMLMISGKRQVLETVGRKGPAEINIIPPTMCRAALHSKFRSYVAEATKTYLEQTMVNNPEIPIASALKNTKIITKKEKIIENIVSGEINTLYLEKLIKQIESMNIDNIFCVGPFLRDLNISFKSNINVEYFDEKNLIKLI